MIEFTLFQFQVLQLYSFWNGRKQGARCSQPLNLLWPIDMNVSHHIGGTQARLVGTDLKKMFCPRPKKSKVRGPAFDWACWNHSRAPTRDIKSIYLAYTHFPWHRHSWPLLWRQIRYFSEPWVVKVSRALPEYHMHTPLRIASLFDTGHSLWWFLCRNTGRVGPTRYVNWRVWSWPTPRPVSNLCSLVFATHLHRPSPYHCSHRSSRSLSKPSKSSILICVHLLVRALHFNAQKQGGTGAKKVSKLW